MPALESAADTDFLSQARLRLHAGVLRGAAVNSLLAAAMLVAVMWGRAPPALLLGWAAAVV
ncbi:MAG: hypothetical protein WAQ05_26155, partial [Rubrivivax sp.]